MKRAWRRWRRPIVDICAISLGLFGLSYLPADTSLADREKAGVLRYCVPTLVHPLILDSASGGPGPERRLVEAAAQKLNLRLQLVEAHNIGRSFNPADWNISRGQCDLLGGGFANTTINRSFMTLIPTGQQIGLRLTGPNADPPAGSEVGVFLGSAGLERVRLSRWMRQQNWRAVPLADSKALTRWLAQGRPAIVSTLTALPHAVTMHPLPAAAAEHSELALGLWRGDMTLTRAFREAVEPLL